MDLGGKSVPRSAWGAVFGSYGVDAYIVEGIRMRSGRCQCMPHLKPSEFSGFGPHLTLQLTCCRTERCIFAIGRFIRARCERQA